MQTREKVLLIGLIAVVLFWWARPVLLQSFLEPLNERKADIERISNTLEQKQLQQNLVLAATREMTNYQEQSLPADPYDAQRSYTAWLTDQLEAADWAKNEVTPGKITRFEDLGSSVQVRVEGVATATNLSEFLANFDHSGMLHRLERMSIDSRSIQPGELLDISFTAEAIALKSSKRKDLEKVAATDNLPETWGDFSRRSPFSLLPPEVVMTPEIDIPTRIQVYPGDRLQKKISWSGFPPEAKLSVSLTGEKPAGLEYNESARELIWQTQTDTPLKEHPLALTVTNNDSAVSIRKEFVIDVRLPNATPTVQQPPTQNVFAGGMWQYQLQATDPDQPNQSLNYRIEGSPPAGLQLDSRSGRLQWSPAEDQVGQEIRLNIVVTDNGSPSKEARTSFNVSVKADLEPTTQLVGCLQVDGEWTAWFREKSSQDRFQLQLGDRLEVSRFQATISQINVDRIVLENENGQQVLRVGKLLIERQSVQ
ncbi:MAG TPA: hypothetical protein DD473_14435 [Planctomycetaceae bacterium]|nr:hypothetical protein [Planctomycetaceae bacterium]